MAQRRILRRRDKCAEQIDAAGPDISAAQQCSMEAGDCSQPLAANVATPQKFDAKLMDILRSNYDLISVIAEIDAPTPGPGMTSFSTLPTVNVDESTQSVGSNDGVGPRCASVASEYATRRRPPAEKSRLTLRAKKSMTFDGDVDSNEPSTSSSDSSERNSLKRRKRSGSSNSDVAENDSLADRWGRALSTFAAEIVQAVTDDTSTTTTSPTKKHDATRKKSLGSAATLPKLSPHTLRRDIRRCLAECQHYLTIGAGFYDIVVWNYPLATLSLFAVYLFGIWAGWLVPMIMFLVLAQFALNWLEHQKKIRFGLFLFPHRTTASLGDAQDTTGDLSGAQLIFDVARRAQSLLTFAADGLEKLHALMTWRRPEVTARFVGIVATFFVLSLVMSTSAWFILVGSLIGGKTFLMTFLYHRFPRLRPLLDIAYYFYMHLPTATDDAPRRQSETDDVARRFSVRNSLAIYRNRSLLPTLSTAATHSVSPDVSLHASTVDIAVAVATTGNFMTLGRRPSAKHLTGAMLSPMLIKSGKNEANNRRRSICVMSADSSPQTLGRFGIDIPSSPTTLNLPHQMSEPHKLATSRRQVSQTQSSRSLTPQLPRSESGFVDETGLDNLSANTPVHQPSFGLALDADIPTQEVDHQISEKTEHFEKEASLNNEIVSPTTSSGDAATSDDDNDGGSVGESISSTVSTAFGDSNDNTPWYSPDNRKLSSMASDLHDRTTDFDDVIRISRPCFMMTKNRLIEDPINPGVLILSERMLSFQFDSTKRPNRLMRMKRIFCRNAKCATNDGVATLDIPFPSIVSLRKLHRNSRRRRSSNSSLLLSVLRIHNSAADDGIELCLAHDQPQEEDSHVVVRFTGIAHLDEFYEALVDTARIAADVDLDNDDGLPTCRTVLAMARPNPRAAWGLV